VRLDYVMDQLRPVVGLTSVLAASASVRFEGARADQVTLGGAREALAQVEHAQQDAGSDAAYWGYQGQVSYWRAVVSLLDAAELTGPDHLPDVAMPDLSNKVVMDASYEMEKWAKRVLEMAQATDPPRT
jgi:hypothetical protein